MIEAHRLLVATVALAALTLGGCSTPVKYVSLPEANKTSPRSSLPAAVDYLQAARRQYQDAVETQMSRERNLTNGLIGAGALAVGLALGDVSGGAIAGTALLAGTAYTLGNVNYNRQSVLIYQAGIDALNCAEKAVAPLDIDAQQISQLSAALEVLVKARTALAGELAAGRALSRGALAGALEKPALDAALEVGEQAVRDSDTTLRAARALIAMSSRAARELVVAVNGIDAAVARSLVSATPDLSSVPGLVAGLAGVAGSFAPGKGIDPSLLSKIERASGEVAGATAKSLVAERSKLLIAADKIIAATRTAAAADAAVRGLMPAGPVVWPEDAFKSCGVAQVVSALSVSTSTLRFTAGVDDRQQFEIVGGVKPYFVRIDGPSVDGLTVRSPVRFDNLAEVVVDGKKITKALTTALRVVDSSPTPLGLGVTVDISLASGEPEPKAAPAAPTPAPRPGAGRPATPAGPAPPPAQGPGVVVPGTPASPTADAELARLVAMSRFKIGDKTFMLVQTPVLEGDTVRITVKCPDGEVRKRSELARAIRDQVGIQGPPKHNWRVVTVPPGCAED